MSEIKGMNQFERDLVHNKEVTKIPYGSLQVSKHNSYDPFIDIDSLTESIRAIGLLTPLSVIGPDENGKYEILSGERRYHAIGRILRLEGDDKGTEPTEEEKKLEEVPCYVIGEASMPVLQQKLIIETANIETRPQSYVNEHRINVMEILLEMQDQEGFSDKVLIQRMMKYIGGNTENEDYRKDYTRAFLRVGKADPVLKNAVKNRKLSLMNAMKLTSIAKPYQAEAAIKVINKELTVKEALGRYDRQWKGMEKLKKTQEEKQRREQAEDEGFNGAEQREVKETAPKLNIPGSSPLPQEAETTIPEWFHSDEDEFTPVGDTDYEGNTSGDSFGYEDDDDAVYTPDFDEDEVNRRLQRVSEKYNTRIMETDSSGLHGSLLADNAEQDKKKYEKLLRDIAYWCNKISKKSYKDLSDNEKTTVKACIQIASVFRDYASDAD